MPTSIYELRELIEELEKIRGRHTELVTVLIPAGANIYTIADQIAAEQSTADNIKSKTVRKNVTDALEMVGRELKKYRQTLPNGLAIFCGNVSDKEGEQNLKLWIIEPPQPLKTRMYRCDQVFIIEPLKEMFEAEEVYGLVVMDKREATIGLLEGKQIKVLRKMTSGIPGKYKTGGQCLSPDTLIETNNGIKKIIDLKIGEEIKALDIANNKIIFTKCINKWENKKSEYLIIITKNNKLECSSDHLLFIADENRLIEMSAGLILKGAPLLNNSRKRESIIKISKIKKEAELIDIKTEEENFFANNLLVHNSAARFERIRDGLAKEFYRKIADCMKDFFFSLPRLKGILIGGPIPSKEEFLADGQLNNTLKDKIIATKDLGNTDESGLEDLVKLSQDELSKQEIIKEQKILEKFFQRLGKEDKVAYKKEDVDKALKYGAVQTLILSNKLHKSVISELSQKAQSISAEVEFVSTETPEGAQFFNLGGMGALLRFEV